MLIVGLVSPEPMMTSSRGIAATLERTFGNWRAGGRPARPGAGRGGRGRPARTTRPARRPRRPASSSPMARFCSSQSSPVSAITRSTGTSSFGMTVDGRCSHSDRRMRRWRSRLSQGRMVPSGRCSKLAMVASMPQSDQVGMGPAQPAPRSSPPACRPAAEAPAPPCTPPTPATGGTAPAPHRRSPPRRPPARAPGRPGRRRCSRPSTGRPAPRSSKPTASSTAQQVGAHGGEVVAVVGLVAPAVAPEVDGGDGMAQLVQPGGHALPRPAVGRQPVDEQERDAGAAGPDVTTRAPPRRRPATGFIGAVISGCSRRRWRRRCPG